MRVGGIKTKTLKLVFDTSPLGMQHSDVQSKDNGSKSGNYVNCSDVNPRMVVSVR